MFVSHGKYIGVEKFPNLGKRIIGINQKISWAMEIYSRLLKASLSWSSTRAKICQLLQVNSLFYYK